MRSLIVWAMAFWFFLSWGFAWQDDWSLFGVGAAFFVFLFIVRSCIGIRDELYEWRLQQRKSAEKERRAAAAEAAAKRQAAAEAAAEQEADVAAEQALQQMTTMGDRSLSPAEKTRARELVLQGGRDGLLLVAQLLESVDATPGDVADVFTSDVLHFLGRCSAPESWPITAAAIEPVPPAVRLFASDLNSRLPRLFGIYWPRAGASAVGRVGLGSPEYECYRVLLENDFPPSLVKRILPTVVFYLSESYTTGWFEDHNERYEYAFEGAMITRLSRAGATLLAALPPDETAEGSWLRLSHLTALSDDVAGIIAKSQRSISFGALQSFPDTAGHMALAARLATQDVILVGSNVSVGPQVAAILTHGRITRPLFGSGLDTELRRASDQLH